MINNSKNNPEPLTFFKFLASLTGINTLLNSVLFVGGIFVIDHLITNQIIAGAWGLILFVWYLFFLPVVIGATIIVSAIFAFTIKLSTNSYTKTQLMAGVGINFLLFIIIMLWLFYW